MNRKDEALGLHDKHTLIALKVFKLSPLNKKCPKKISSITLNTFDLYKIENIQSTN